jgi:hypothetical protein
MIIVPGYPRPPLATPPEVTISVPPLPSLMPLTTPPAETVMTPPEMTL